MSFAETRSSLPAPLVGIPCCLKQIDGHPFQAAGEKYVIAVSEGAACTPLLIPSLPSPLDAGRLLDSLDGLLITGSPSNVAPHLYGGPPPRPGVAQDPQRDATTLPLLRLAIARGVPVIAICRGFQELNVALGGTLHQHLEEVPGRMDHRGGEGEPAHVYRYQHEVAFAPGGHFARISGGRAGIRVNSVHGQGVDRLAPGLAVEATAPDGTIEAFRVEGAAFALATQWHPEWRYWEDDFSTALFAAFGAAVRDHAARRAANSDPARKEAAHG